MSNLLAYAQRPKGLLCFAAQEGIVLFYSEMLRLRSLPRSLCVSWYLRIRCINSGLIRDFLRSISCSLIASRCYLADSSIAFILSLMNYILPCVTMNDRLIFLFIFYACSWTNLPLVSITSSLNITLAVSDSLLRESSFFFSINLKCMLVCLSWELALFKSLICCLFSSVSL